MAAKYPRHAKVVAWAQAELAKGVHEIPDGSNRGPRVEFYQAHTWLGGTGWPWCAAFVDTAWEVGGGLALPWRTAGAWDMGDRARKAGWTVRSPAELVPGDPVVWAFGTGHVSLFLSTKDGWVTTIDGNVSNKVDKRTRPVTQVRDFIHVPELAVPLPAKDTRPPVFEVVGADDGERVIYVSGARAVGRNLAKILGRHPEGVVIRRRKPSR